VTSDDQRQPNRSALTQAAAEAELSRHAGLEWLSQVAALPATGVEHHEVAAAVAAACEDLAGNEQA
jgi:post-segregation antitoxin (ccd killing protein)